MRPGPGSGSPRGIAGCTARNLRLPSAGDQYSSQDQHDPITRRSSIAPARGNAPPPLKDCGLFDLER